VRELLTPSFIELKNIDAKILVVSAGEVGTQAGPPRILAMLEAGLERVSDRIGYHIYSPEVIPLLSDHGNHNLIFETRVEERHEQEDDTEPDK
jgi:hypothetical protein